MTKPESTLTVHTPAMADNTSHRHQLRGMREHNPQYITWDCTHTEIPNV